MKYILLICWFTIIHSTTFAFNFTICKTEFHRIASNYCKQYNKQLIYTSSIDTLCKYQLSYLQTTENLYSSTTHPNKLYRTPLQRLQQILAHEPYTNVFEMVWRGSDAMVSQIGSEKYLVQNIFAALIQYPKYLQIFENPSYLKYGIVFGYCEDGDLLCVIDFVKD